MVGDEIYAIEVSEEVIVQATLRMPNPPSADDDALTLTVGEFKQAVVAVLARYGARLTDEEPEGAAFAQFEEDHLGVVPDSDDHTHDIARLADEGNPNHTEHD